MFDIGFWELILTGIIGLIILGPERMPQAVRAVSQWINAVRSMAGTVKDQVSRELKIEQLHADLKKAEQQGLKDLSPELNDSVDELKKAAKFVNKPFAPEDKSASQTSNKQDS